MQPEKVVAIVPPPLKTIEGDASEARDFLPPLHTPARIILLVLALLLMGVFAIAIYLNPYRDGMTWRMETHTQLGLRPCTFYEVTGLPCPSCGMTTSFALTIRGDLANALRANSVGTLLAIVCLMFIPWALVSAWRGQPLVIRSLDRTLMVLLVSFLWLMLFRWVTVLTLAWWNGAF